MANRLRKELHIAAVKRNDRVVLLSHVPLYVGASSLGEGEGGRYPVIYDADEVMELIHSEGHGSVVAVIAGHLHRLGYGVDDHGVHHRHVADDPLRSTSTTVLGTSTSMMIGSS